MKKQSIHRILALVILIFIFAWIVFDVKDPGCANAQGACWPVYSFVTKDDWTGWFGDGGGCGEVWLNNSDPSFRGKTRAEIALRGFTLNYDDDDHNLDRSAVYLDNVTINSGTGTVSYHLVGCWDDKNDDDDFHYEAWYTIIAY